MQSVFVHGKTWFDKVNGDSYFSARVFVDGVEVARLPFQYGYGDQYDYVAQYKLQAMGLLPESTYAGLGRQVRELGGSFYSVLEQTRKADCVGWGKAWVSA